jgi:hypothetical protein
MRVYTVSNTDINPSAQVKEFELSSGIKIAAVVIGEQGRGRSTGIVPVDGAQPGDMITNVLLTTTKAGKPKFRVVAPEADTDNAEAAIVVLESTYGFRGNNSHTGDRVEDYDPDNIEFLSFPLEVLARGMCADGMAGNMADGEQFICVARAGQIWRVGKSGRLYGNPSAYYYRYTPEQGVQVATWDEREMTEVF